MSGNIATTTATIVAEITGELQAELSADGGYNATLLSAKVRDAYREVKMHRHYPSAYTDAMIESDMANFYMNVKDLARYDYNQVGGEFQESHSENAVSRKWMERNKLFAGVLPICRGV